ncbi:TetR/AcrR family transcriptional regulator [Pseudomonas sp. N040]|uniref:TetR/AcrR family transcriptional regulator n=1 Tax=Pseudomonas sp. N040 TaxID=2785325 RepID=UPI0018A292B0|nr:TetR/AcrR family transcriptional regulator [Pseudomonas sp. N040]MBF7730930.1 TetR/AcrR family transcriptional regulator [Pseudomonas sp. N040]MBW7014573.1 TetR/AcrR family transcriptional regulator [Pseudomonas sp. N040]
MVYRTTSLRLDRDQELRARILECALARVSDGGFASLTMQALAGDVGLATGSLYRHFRNKAQLACEVFASASGREVEALAVAFAAPGTPGARLAQGIRQFATRAWHSRQLAFALIAEPVEPEVDEQRLRYREAYAELFGRLLAEGVASGDFQVEQIRLASACLVGAIAEALVGPLAPAARVAQDSGRTASNAAEISRHLITFCLRAVGAKEY